MQERDTHDFLYVGAHRLIVKDSFVKFWIQSKHAIDSEEVIIKGSTIIYGKLSECIFPKAKKFICTESFIKNVEICYKPFSEALREMVIVSNDYYGVL